MLTAGSYRLLRNYNGQVRIDVDLAEAVWVDPVTPEGWGIWYCGQLSLAPDGAVLYTLTDNVVAQVWAYDLDNDAWSPVGKAFGLIQSVEQIATNSENLVWGRAYGLPVDLYGCDEALEDEPPPGTLIGDASQLVSSTTGFQMDLDYQLKNISLAVNIDGGERCVALGLQQGNWIVRPLDDSGVEVDFGDSWLWHWLD
jgi:hypothetical protein